MRIIMNDAWAEFTKIVTAIKLDPASWEKWQILSLATQTKMTDYSILPLKAYLTNEIARESKHIDGVAYICDDGQAFLLCRDISTHTLRALGCDVIQALYQQYDIRASYTLYMPSIEENAIYKLVQHAGVYPSVSNNKIHTPNDMLTRFFTENQEVFATNLHERAYHPTTTILLVEDDPFARRIVSKCIKDDGQLITATNATEAIAQYVLYAPDIVLLDIGLPDYDGFTVINTLKAHDPDAYIVMFSAKHYAENIVHALNMGAKGFIEKPFKKQRITHYINAYHQAHAAQMN